MGQAVELKAREGCDSQEANVGLSPMPPILSASGRVAEGRQILPGCLARDGLSRQENKRDHYHFEGVPRATIGLTDPQKGVAEPCMQGPSVGQGEQLQPWAVSDSAEVNVDLSRVPGSSSRGNLPWRSARDGHSGARDQHAQINGLPIAPDPQQGLVEHGAELGSSSPATIKEDIQQDTALWEQLHDSNMDSAMSPIEQQSCQIERSGSPAERSSRSTDQASAAEILSRTFRPESALWQSAGAVPVPAGAC